MFVFLKQLFAGSLRVRAFTRHRIAARKTKYSGVLVYMMLTQLMKRFYIRRFGWQ